MKFKQKKFKAKQCIRKLSEMIQFKNVNLQLRNVASKN